MKKSLTGIGCGALLLAAAALQAEENSSGLSYLGHEIGGTAFPASWTPAEVMLEEQRLIRSVDPTAQVSFRVWIHASELNKSMVELGLPTGQDFGISEDPEATRNVELEVPFRPDDFLQSGQVDEPAFAQHVWEVLDQLMVDEAYEGDAALCAGFLEGTKIKVNITDTSLKLSTLQPSSSDAVHVTYRCQPQGWSMGKVGWGQDPTAY